MRRRGRALHVAVDTLSIQASSAGIQVYLRELLEPIRNDAGVRLTLIRSASNATALDDLPSNAVVTIPWGTRNPAVRVLTQQLIVPLLLLVTIRPDLLFAPVDIAPLLAPVPIVTTVHSSHLNAHFGFADWMRSRYSKLMFAATMRRSRKVIAISGYVGRATAAMYDLPEDRLEVIPSGGGAMERILARGWEPPPLRSRTGGILFLGSLHPHKRVDALLQAYALLRDDARFDLPLSVVGKDVDGERERLRSIASRLGVDGSVRFEGRVTDDALLGLFATSRLLVLPSEVEGFGLPVVEAMHAGVPIVVSDRTCLPEIVGDAGLVADPDDVEALAGAMERVLADEALAERLVAAGRLRGREFGWPIAAQRTVTVWRQTASAGSGTRMSWFRR